MSAEPRAPAAGPQPPTGSPFSHRRKVGENGMPYRPACRGPLDMVAAVALVCLVAIGCQPDISSGYGRRRAPNARTSVVGTAVLAEMFEQAGDRVFSWYLLSPRIRDRADCVVWFPDDFEPPNKEARQWLEDWLLAVPGRTLIYVGRDFDAPSWYWQRVKPDTPSEQRPEINHRAAVAKSEFRIERQAIPNSEDCEWFTVKGQYQPRKVRSLQGAPDWVAGIDPAGLEIELNGRFLPSRDAQVLLASEGDMLISRQQWDESQLIVVTNGSFLLNLPLVNHEHRKLAGKLIGAVGPPGQTVVFLESSAGGPFIRDEDPAAGMPTGLEIFNIWPTNWILLHLAIAGIIFCFSRWPVLGRPYEPEPPSQSDFGQHIRALAELLKRSRDHAYATTRLLRYQQTTRPGE